MVPKTKQNPIYSCIKHSASVDAVAALNTNYSLPAVIDSVQSYFLADY